VDDGVAEVVHSHAVAEASGLEEVLTVVQADLHVDGGGGLVEQVTELVSLPSIRGVLVEPVFARMQHLPMPCALAAWLRGASLAAAAVAAGARCPVIVVPGVAVVRAQAIRVPSLAGSHGPVGSVCGFAHAPFDAIEADWHTHVFTYPLWQYEWTPAGPPVTLARLAATDDALVTAVQRLAAAASTRETAAARAADVKTSAHLGTQTLTFAAEVAVADPGTTFPDAVMLWVDWFWSDDARAEGKDGGDPAPWLSTHPEAAPWTRQHVRFLPPSLGPGGYGGRRAAPLSVSLALRPSGGEEGGIDWDVVVASA
jgi:hypothetical protein